MKKNLKEKLSFFTAIFLLLFLIIGVFFLFYIKLNSAIQEINYSFMQEVATQQSISFKAKLDGQFEQLKLYSRSFENIDMRDYTTVKKVLNVTNGVGDFKRISIANDIGVVTNNDNTTSPNIIKEDYFINALKGEQTISSNLILDNDGDEIIVIATPIYKKDKIIGVILGTFNRDTLKELFRQDNFSGKGISFIFNKEGTIISKNNENNFLSDSKNIYEGLSNLKYPKNSNAEKVKVAIENSEIEIIEYYIASHKRMAVCTPIPSYNWYLFSAVDLNFIKVQSNQITLYVLILVLGISALLLIFMVALYYYIKANRKIKIKNQILATNDERYKLVNCQTDNVIFEYNYSNNTIYLSGDIQEVLNTDNDTLNLYFSDEIKTLTQNRGFNLFDDIDKTTLNNIHEYEKEFRYLTFENKYKWFRIKAIFSYDKNNQPLKILGSITDIQKQKEETEKLRYKAEIDQLTGILNKKSIEEYVQKVLDKANKNSIYAVYIIDLDNFKGINDNLGHLFGDEVLKDVGFKMKRIFRENDYLGRIGGDEFLAFLNYGEGSYEDALKVIEKRAERLCQDFRENYSGENSDYKVSASIGIAVYPKDGLNYQQLFINADKALYISKKKGKDNYSIYTEEAEGGNTLWKKEH